jgi:hypothetical protein
LKINLSCLSLRFYIILNPSKFGLFWNQCFSFTKPRVFSKVFFVNTKEKTCFEGEQTLIPEKSELVWDCKYPKFRAEIYKFLEQLEDIQKIMKIEN